jgi:ribosomal protein S18 acetylase RimI-like enzyme
MNNILEYYDRFVRYRQKNGILKTFQRMYEKTYQHILTRDDHIFYIDLKEYTPKFNNTTDEHHVQPIESVEQLSEKDLSVLYEHIGKNIITPQLKFRFSISATMWVIKIEDNIAGYVWSTRKSKIKPYYIPLGENDVFMFDGSVISKYRGRNVYPQLLSNVVSSLKQRNFYRVIFDAHGWNSSVIRSFNKIGAKQLGIVRRYKFGRNNFLLWVSER